MKKLTLIILSILMIVFNLKAQDKIIKNDGTTALVNISEINDDEIVYSYPGESLINKESIEKISKIVFESGRTQTFSSTTGFETYGLNLPEPEFTGEILYINDKNEVIELEQQKASRKSGGNASLYLTGIGKVKVKNKVDGASSPVKIKPSKEVQFLVKVPDNEYNPQDEINIFQLESNKKNRIIEVASASSFGTSKSNDIEFYDFNAKKYGESSYLLTVELIEEGEYTITLKDSREVFNMFSINN